MEAREIKHHFKKFFGYELPQTQINVFSPEFVEFCIYITTQKSAQASLSKSDKRGY